VNISVHTPFSQVETSSATLKRECSLSKESNTQKRPLVVTADRTPNSKSVTSATGCHRNLNPNTIFIALVWLPREIERSPRRPQDEPGIAKNSQQLSKTPNMMKKDHAMVSGMAVTVPCSILRQDFSCNAIRPKPLVRSDNRTELPTELIENVPACGTAREREDNSSASPRQVCKWTLFDWRRQSYGV
jgi:hypothetical protein